MSSHRQPLFRAFLGLVLACAALQPLRAQLDPKLQSSKTDFLDMYQQSSSLKAKPEIATIFDCSGSMNSLMFHPLYQNNDSSDADAYRYMRFVLTPKSVSNTLPAGNVYKLTAAVKSGCTSGTAVTLLVTVNANGTATISNQSTPVKGCTTLATKSTYTITASAAGNSSATTTITFTSTTTSGGTFINYTTSGTNTASGGYTFVKADGTSTTPLPTITVDSSGPYQGTNLVTLTTYLKHPFSAESENVNNKSVNWTATSGTCTAAVWTEVVANTLYKSTTTWVIPTATTATNPTLLTPLQVVNTGTGAFYPMNTTFSAGTTLTLNDYFVNTGTSSQIVWTVANNNGSTYIPSGSLVNPSPGTTTPSPQTSYNATSQNVKWTIPAFNSQIGGGVTSDGYVTVTLDASASTYMGTGAPSVGTLTGTTKAAGAPYEVLRKPDGTAVTATDANNASGTLYGEDLTEKEKDVRNWVRAASHVRFYSGNGTSRRTIDIPIPWKITAPHVVPATGSTPMHREPLSSGSPLSSTMATDQEITTTTTNGTSITTTYGSGKAIELDQTFRIEGVQGAVFCADNNGSAVGTGATTTIWLNTVAYRPAYINWLFLGQYQNDTTKPYYNAAYSGKYIVFDAVGNFTQVGGQTNQAGGSSSSSWGAGYGPLAVPWDTISVSQYSSTGAYTTSTLVDASKYFIPAFTRIQAVKSAAIRTWIEHQADVFWAFRELDSSSNEANSGSAKSINNDSSATITGATPIPPTGKLYGNDSGWTILNNYLASDSTTTTSGNNVTVKSNDTGHSMQGMARIAYFFANGGTPLTYAMARTLAQYNDPSSVFNAVEGVDTSQCMNSYLLLFTDGLDTNGSNYNTINNNGECPYIPGGVGLDVTNGNLKIIGSPTSIDRDGPWWNTFTFAGIAAHLSAPTNGGKAGVDYMPQPQGVDAKTGNLSPSAYLPFAINQRGSGANQIKFKLDHQVTVMTLGVSLGGNTTSGPKKNLFWTAIAGDPLTTTPEPISKFHTFVPPNYFLADGVTAKEASDATYPGGYIPNDWVYNDKDRLNYPTSGQRTEGAVYFFDATDPDKVSEDLKYAFMAILQPHGNNTTSSPDLPFIGASLGQQIYIGSFQPPPAGGVIWPGDLWMFPTRQVGGSTTMLDSQGVTISEPTAAKATWSASSALSARSWKQRLLYTRLPSTNGSEPGLTRFSYLDPWFDDGAGGGLKTCVSPSLGADNQRALIQFASGGDTSKLTPPTPPTDNRANIMGDVIDSSPSALEYNFTQVKDNLTPRLAALADAKRFRLILVGTNQGWIHAFGETSTTIPDPKTSGKTLVSAVSDELWAFMPTDFLPNLSYINQSGNSHRFMADGTPALYFLDLPPTTGGAGNGVVESSERAVAVVGLGKGGRSYYALDIHDPFKPSLRWSLVPDEAANFPAARIISGGPSLDTVKAVLGNFGFSTSTPSFGRVSFNGILHDCVFLGGGLSEPEVEVNFGGKSLGRSVMALDVYSGQVLAAVDLTDSKIGGSTVGPVGAGLVPFEYIVNSGMAQRAYFLDYNGGLWAWGSKAVSSNGAYKDFRIDSADLSTWKIRKVFQDDNTAASGLGARYSTTPAPFRVGNFPGPAQSGKATPSAAGIAMVSGDRNNPLDRNYYTPGNPAPTNHQLTVVFDRQDSRALSLDSDTGPDDGIKPDIGGSNRLVGLSTSDLLTTPSTPCSDDVFKAITSSCTSSYFLGTASAPKYGYYVKFPSITSAGYLPKGINPPLVVSNTLFYDYFFPTSSNPCTGGSGYTYSWIIANVMSPIVSDKRTGVSLLSGQWQKWAGVASDFISVGSTSVLQAGTLETSNPANPTTMAILSQGVNASARFPRIRVWRDVQ